MDYLGQFAIVHLILHVICICIAYLALNSVRLDQFFKKGYALQVQICMIFLAILLGTSVSNFIVDLLQYSTQVKYIFK
ncbi:DUF1146 family protein [Staphylococcus saccharolyticus]|uniref:DUF1146 family protein n=1 Tax=Staphylococcus saccharolyticus TaxID=33028 RepID=UPI00102D7F96|nr:DUF1146 family protein [Staphylococcus saccharolyticus]MBL7574176.1 DUF1146 domain-containing protein [Staphylococcus saccharolyticus]MBL7585178.1 DUF1146 domain-containing protein [Staphylococcus saccharolyticus]MBL7639788.1 DUF1146 domain-containing protein [Staphylococcus saccharolyticus]QRJ68920.1 DUF1146 domain-containing protein [Staphylococcus saccharolyticus]TAA91037.1 DUF1146 domain-containing protein [Staphylococcus saccharolyticus]